MGGDRPHGRWRFRVVYPGGFPAWAGIDPMSFMLRHDGEIKVSPHGRG